MIRVLLSLCVLFAAAAPASASFQDLSTQIADSGVSWVMRPQPSGEAVEFHATFPVAADATEVTLRIPYWKPGSYSFSQFEKSINELKVVNDSGDALSVVQPDPRSWVVNATGASELLVTYVLESNNSAFTSRTPAVHLHGPSTFLYTDDTLLLPHSLLIDLPEGWSFSSGHTADTEWDNLFHSINYDEFVDCPMAFGELEEYEFTSYDTKFEVVFFGKMPSEKEFSRESWLGHIQRIVEAGHELMGGFPFDRYVFLYMIGGTRGGWGLEHLNSTTIAFNDYFLRNNDLDGFGSITSHEFFHLWNVKRIRPKQLGPFDYATDVHTRDLWWLEGVTSYYQDILLQRSGLRAHQENWFWNMQIDNLRNLRYSNGYGVLSPETTSWDIWDPKSKLRVSYYDQGQAAGLMLDILIRNHTKNERSLDDVVRFLDRWVSYPNPGYEPGDIERAIFSVTGWNPKPFFDRYIHSHEEFPFAEVLPLAGVDFFDFPAGGPRFGFTVDDELKLTKVDLELGALMIDDVLLKIGDTTITRKEDIRTALTHVSAGDEIIVRVGRTGSSQAKDIALTVGKRKRSILQARPMPHPNDLQKEIRDGLLAAD